MRKYNFGRQLHIRDPCAKGSNQFLSLWTLRTRHLLCFHLQYYDT